MKTGFYPDFQISRDCDGYYLSDRDTPCSWWTADFATREDARKVARMLNENEPNRKGRYVARSGSGQHWITEPFQSGKASFLAWDGTFRKKSTARAVAESLSPRHK